MSVFHTECWKKKYPESKAAGSPARYASKACGICGNPIDVGQLISWPRRGKYTAGNSTHQATDGRHTETETETETTKEEAHAATEAATAHGCPKCFPGADGPNCPAHEREERKERSTAKSGGSADGIAQAIADLVMPVLETRLEDAISGLNVKTLVADVVAQATKALGDVGVRRVEVKLPDGTKNDIGVQHKDFDKLLKCCAARVNVWMVGPAGSGKTTAAHNVAKALGLDFYYTGAISDGYQLTGFRDAHSHYEPPAFRKAWEFGGIFLFDDFDSSDPNAAMTLAAALANGHCAFPDGLIERHPDCVIILAANTWGLGATNEYVGRNRQDAAFLDRFAFLLWGYDEALERQTCGNPEWCDRVIEVRRKVTARGIKVLITPRASYAGAKLLAAGFSRADVEVMTLRKGMTDEQWKSIHD